MQLRTWAVLMVLGIFLLIASGARADGIWDDMRDRSNVVRGKIETLEIRGNSLRIEIGGQTLSSPFCADSAGASEYILAVYIQEQMAALREAWRSQAPVEISLRGPWSPCVSAIRVTRGA
ncbi:MAG: hypothetical protein HC902_10745 [Calothrix sp. SM1_5_4]|nr:hypothetical protein [Calothrix sp. SM1_5_4]